MDCASRPSDVPISVTVKALGLYILWKPGNAGLRGPRATRS